MSFGGIHGVHRVGCTVEIWDNMNQATIIQIAFHHEIRHITQTNASNSQIPGGPGIVDRNHTVIVVTP